MFTRVFAELINEIATEIFEYQGNPLRGIYFI